MVLSWFRKVISTSRHPKAAKSQRPRYHKVYLELLEDRTLLSAYVFTVNTLGDAGLSDGTKPTMQNGQSLDYKGDIRYVLNQINTGFYSPEGSNGVNTNTVVFDPSLAGKTITLNSGDGNGNDTDQGELTIAYSTSISNTTGSNITISGQNLSRVINISSQSETVSISGLTITKGNAKPAPNNGGTYGGDIFNSGNLILTGDVVSDGRAFGDANDQTGQGGGIFNAGGTDGVAATLIVDSTTVTGNIAEGYNFVDGLSNTTWSGQGGGIYNDASASLTLQNGTAITANQAIGGAGNNFYSVSDGSTPTGQTSGNNGVDGLGGVSSDENGGYAGNAYGGGVFNAGSLAINGSSTAIVTFTGNLAKGGTGADGNRGGNGGSGSNGIAGVSGGNTTGGNGGNGVKGGDGGYGGPAGSAFGGAVYSGAVVSTGSNSAKITEINYATLSGDAADGGNGGNAGAGGIGGNGGNAAAGAGPAPGGDSGTAGTAANGGAGGLGADGGVADGGGLYSTGTLGNFSQVNIYSETAQGGMGGYGGAGGQGGTGGNGAAGSGDTTNPISPPGTAGANAGDGGAAGNGGAGGNAQGGGVYISGTGTAPNFASVIISGSQALAGAGNYGGIGGLGGNGGTGGAGEGTGPAGQGGDGGTSVMVAGHPVYVAGGAGGKGGIGGLAQGGGLYSATTLGTLSTVTFGVDSTTSRNDAAIAAIGGAGGAGGKAGTAGAGGAGTAAGTAAGQGAGANGGVGYAGGAAGVGGAGGQAEGGGLYNTAATGVINGSLFLSNTAQGGLGGAGANGGVGGTGGTGGNANGGTYAAVGGNGGNAGVTDAANQDVGMVTQAPGYGVGGNGSIGGAGGKALGGGFYSTGVLGTFTNVTFSTDTAQGATGGAGGAGGMGGSGGAGGSGVNINNNGDGDGGTASVGGNAGATVNGVFTGGGAGGNAEGGGLYSSGGYSNSPGVFTTVTFSTDKALAGAGGAGMAGGAGGNANDGPGNGNNQFAGNSNYSDYALPPGVDGGVGGAGGKGGIAEGGGFFNSSGAISITTGIFSSDVASSGAGGTGGAGGASGNTFVPPSNNNGDLPVPNGENGGAGGNSGIAAGGGLFNSGGDVTLTGGMFTANQVISANGGVGGVGGNGGVDLLPPQGGNALGGDAGVGGVGGNAGTAAGGAVSLANGNLFVYSTTFGSTTTATAGNTVTGGAGGVGGVGGVGAASLSGSGGFGGAGGLGGNGAAVYGGAIDVGAVNSGINAESVTLGTVGMTATADTFGYNAITSGAGGAGGNGGADGSSQQYYYGVPYNGEGGSGGNGGVGYGGGFSYYIGSGIANNSTSNTVAINESAFDSNSVKAGKGGNGGALGGGADGGGATSAPGNNSGQGTGSNVGQGGYAGEVRGGGAVVYNMSVSGATAVNVGASSFANNTLTGGTGGEGTLGNGGGNGSSAYGGGMDIIGATAASATFMDTSFSSNAVKAGNGGLGTIAGDDSYEGPYPTDAYPYGGTTTGGVGGTGGTAGGGGIASDNYNFTFNSAVADTSPVNGNSVQGGVGGNGGFGNGPGGAAGGGGTAAGGGVYFSNTTNGQLMFSFTANSVSGNSLTGGAGGVGGDSGGNEGSTHVKAGVGGAGGLAVGGGLYLVAGTTSSSAAYNTIIVNSSTLDGNVITAGAGGNGGKGEGYSPKQHGDAITSGGNAGAAAGGGIYINSTNSTAPGTASMTDDTLAGNSVNGGVGGTGGTGNESNGGYGGDGGVGGNGVGGGLYVGDNSSADAYTLTVYNTTFGGASLSSTNPNENENIVAAGNGGNGGNGGTDNGKLAAASGGYGGAGGSVAGGGVWVDDGTSTFVNDTIIYNIADLTLAPYTGGNGGAPGAAAGNGTQPSGKAGNVGTAGGGGYFSANINGTAVNNVANTIIDLNDASSNLTGSVVTTDPDVSGAFTDKGNNILGPSTNWSARTTGFPTNTPAPGGNGDQIGVAANDVTVGMTTTFGLDLGPLQNNGGPTPTDGELANSVARNNGSTALADGVPLSTDQRGPGYPRENMNVTPYTVDVGAFELILPAISALNPSSVTLVPMDATTVPDVQVVISGTGFSSNSTVTFGGTSVNSTYDSTMSDANYGDLIASIPETLLRTDYSTNPTIENIVVSNPDASGLTGPGHTDNSNAQPFSIYPPAPGSFTVNTVTTQTSNEGALINLIVTSSDPYANNFMAAGLPQGLSITTTGSSPGSYQGVISGTIGAYDGDNSPYTMVTITATDDGTPGSTTFTWNVNKTSPPMLTNPGSQSGQTGTAVSLQINSNNSNMDATAFNDLNSSSKDSLPPGLSINSSGLIMGTPTKVGTYNVFINATRNGGTGANDTAQITFTWTIIDPNAPSITNPGNQTATTGVMIGSIQLQYKNITSFSANGTLPPGLAVSNSGLISGTPFRTDDKNYNVTITGTGSDGSTSVSFKYTINGGTGTNTGPGTPVPVDTVVLLDNGGLVEFIPTATPGVFSSVTLSGVGTIKAVSTVLDASGNTDVFAIGTTYNPSTNPINTPIGVGGAQYNNNLWEYIFGSWHRQSSGAFQQISAATNSSGETIVFALVTNGSLWEQTHSFGVDTGWTELSGNGTIGYISAITDSSGVDHVFIVASASFPAAPLTLWEHLPTGWREDSPGQFSSVSAGLSASGQALAYAVVTNGQLWELNPAFLLPGQMIGNNEGWRELSGTTLGGVTLPANFTSVQAGGPDQVYGITQDHTIWEHTPTVNTHFSSALAKQISATETPSGADEVFITGINDSFYEYSSDFMPGSPFEPLLANGVASNSTPE